MKYQYIYLVWFLFLNDRQKAIVNKDVPHIEQKQKLVETIGRLDLNNENSIKEFLFITAMNSFSNITHRRTKLFSFNPKTKEDMLYLLYIENIVSLASLSFSQRILLSRLVFKNKTKTKTFNDVPVEQIISPIIIEVNNV